MNEYHKIQTVFKRNPDTNYKTLLLGEYSLPEFEYLKNNLWVFTEKVDGTNIRIIWNHELPLLSFKGKTDRAQIPPFLLNALENLSLVEKMWKMFSDADVCLYGEGYGPKIQKGGGNYRKDVSFVLFDIRVGHWWLQRNDIEEIGEKLGVDVVPIIGEGTLDDMCKMAEKGFLSQWGNFTAEGIVARPKIELKSRSGERIITKIKYRDF